MVYKEANNVPILQPGQEAKQKEWLERRMQEKRHKNEVADVFESITRNSKKIQARKLFNYNIVLIGFMEPERAPFPIISKPCLPWISSRWIRSSQSVPV